MRSSSLRNINLYSSAYPDAPLRRCIAHVNYGAGLEVNISCVFRSVPPFGPETEIYLALETARLRCWRIKSAILPLWPRFAAVYSRVFHGPTLLPYLYLHVTT